jgi:hypothetical protein
MLMCHSFGPFLATLTGVSAGHIADDFGRQRMTIVGLFGIAAGSFILSMRPKTVGIPGYIASIVVIIAGYALFQTANNTAVMRMSDLTSGASFPACSTCRAISDLSPAHPSSLLILVAFAIEPSIRTLQAEMSDLMTGRAE